MNNNNIAIDGHSSCGKGTLAKYLAKSLRFKFIDTGSMYRAITYAIQKTGIEITDLDAIKSILAAELIQFKYSKLNRALKIYFKKKNIDKEIRMPAVSSMVSQVSELAVVRSYLVNLQRKMAEKGNVVMDGRDIGTFVLPDAKLKIFMTASIEIRAKRRHKELTDAGIDVPYEQILENISYRDKTDSNREINPLRQAEGAYLLDNTQLSVAEQNKIVLAWAKKSL